MTDMEAVNVTAVASTDRGKAMETVNVREMNGAVVEVICAAVNSGALCVHRITRGAEQVVAVSRGLKYAIYRLTGNGFEHFCPFMDTHPTLEAVVKAEAWMINEPEIDPWDDDTPDVVGIALSELR